MIPIVSPSELFVLKSSHLIIDVRSPGEFDQGHIPGAFNLPLFDNEERAIVGTRYKQAGRDAAILTGLDLVGPKLSNFVKKIKGATHKKPSGLIVHCWRGGMRSQAMAWLLGFAGFQVQILEGGYKNYRTYIRSNLNAGPPFIVLGGMTGCGKTEILHQLKRMGEQVIDLEGLACNKGSVFGYLGQQPQPTNEQFENDLFEIIRNLNPDKPTWVEDESRSIGAVGLPEPFFVKMKRSRLVYLTLPVEVRVKRLVAEYADFSPQMLLDALEKLKQPLGGQLLNEISEQITLGNFAPAIRGVLDYYDKTYLKAFKKYTERRVINLELNSDNVEENAYFAIKMIEKPDHGSDIS